MADPEILVFTDDQVSVVTLLDDDQIIIAYDDDNSPIVIVSSSNTDHQHTESDPIFTASAAYGIASSDISNWNGKTTLAAVKADADISDAITKKHAAGSDAETATTIGTLINGATEKTTPADTDMVGLMDSAASNILKKLSWSNIKATLKTYFDGLYTLANLGGIAKTLFDANTILKADADDTPAALSVPEQTLIGRITSGVIAALTASEVRTLINVEDGSTADQTGAEIKTLYEAEADTNVFTDAEKTKLSGIETAADVTDAGNIATAITGSDAKTTPVDADYIGLIDTEAANVLKKLTWSNIKATLKTYFDALYTIANLGGVAKSLFDANTILAANTDDTPAAVTIAEQTLAGRIAGGNIDDISFLNAHKLLLVIKNFYDPTSSLPATPATGDRYIASATANGWTTNYIYTYNGSSWLETIPTNGFFACLFDRYDLYKYVDSKWMHAALSYYNHGTTTGAGGTKTFNAHDYQSYRIQIAHTTTINPAGTYTSGILYRVIWYIVNGNAAVITWNAAIKWTGGSAPTLTTSGTDIVVFTTVDGGTTWQATLVGKDYK